ncbi:MAG: PHP domain-containing protein, partial [Deltaproteobacteria bacterium]|nr:PHP domain-containing protein [Deltaproteobacteria bacterium]
MADAAGEQEVGRADLHLHTTFSDGTATPEETLNFCMTRTKLRVVAITDHDTIDGALRARRYAEENPDVFSGMHVIVGEEISAREGHVIGLFLEEWIAPGMDAARTIEAIHRQGGIAIAAHPYTNLMKWNNLVGVGDLIRSLPFDAVEIRNANFTEVFANRKATRRLDGKAQTGSSDGHFLESVGRCFTTFPGTTAGDLRSALLGRTTRAEGSCYGLRTLARFVARRIRSGQRVLPDRRHFWRESVDHALAIEVHRSRNLDTAIVTPVGCLDDHALAELKSMLTQLAESGVGLVVDLARVTAMTAHGVTALVGGFRAAQREGVGFCLASP